MAPRGHTARAEDHVIDSAICYTIIERGGPGPLYLLIPQFGWNAWKFFWIGPVSLIVLLSVRAQERRQRRETMYAAVSAEDYAESLG